MAVGGYWVCLALAAQCRCRYVAVTGAAESGQTADAERAR